MRLSSAKRPLLLGVALAVTGAAGAAAAVTVALAGPAPRTPPAAAASQTSPPVAAASNAPAATTPTPTPTPVSLDQARGIAERAGHGQADQVEADAGPGGVTYTASVIRPDGADVRVVIDARTGAVLSTVTEGQDPQDGAS